MVEIADNLSIYKATSKTDFTGAKLFLRQTNLRLFGCEPHNLLPEVFIAKRDNKIVGIVGLDFGNDNKFQLENYWDISQTRLSAQQFRGKIAVCGRLLTEEQFVGIALITCAIDHFLQRNRTFLIIEIKKSVLRLLRKLGFYLQKLSNTTLNLQNIPENKQLYYLTEPYPELFLVDLTKTRSK
jgi:hypothetical protein